MNNIIEELNIEVLPCAYEYKTPIYTRLANARWRAKNKEKVREYGNKFKALSREQTVAKRELRLAEEAKAFAIKVQPVNDQYRRLGVKI